MMLLLSILLASLIGGVSNALVAGLLMNGLPKRWLPRMVVFSAGLLLGLANLPVSREVFKSQTDPHQLFAIMLVGFLGFYALQRVAPWRKAHDEPKQSHSFREGSDRATAQAVLAADAVHNIVDGVLIATAFLTDPHLGWATTVAVTVHRVAQAPAYSMQLRAPGPRLKHALLSNALAASASATGSLLSYLALSHEPAAQPYVLGLAASSFAYIAIADLLPVLRRKGDTSQALWLIVALASGLGLVAILALAHDT